MSPADPVKDAFDLWRRSLEEGTQAWLRSMGQAAPPSGPPPPRETPPLDFGQLWRPILTQGMELWQRAAAQGAVSPDFARQWKSLMDQWIETWTQVLGQVMSTEGFAQALGRYLDQSLAAQAPLRRGVEQQADAALKTLGLPSRGQVVSIAAQVVALEERLEGIEDRLEELARLLRPGGAKADQPAGRGAKARRAREGA